MRWEIASNSYDDEYMYDDVDNDDLCVTYTFPIIGGCEWSSHSIITSPILNSFNFSQFSWASTSISLSDNKYFYGTPASDYIQSIGIINLCIKYKWNKIIIKILECK